MNHYQGELVRFTLAWHVSATASWQVRGKGALGERKSDSACCRQCMEDLSKWWLRIRGHGGGWFLWRISSHKPPQWPCWWFTMKEVWFVSSQPGPQWTSLFHGKPLLLPIMLNHPGPTMLNDGWWRWLMANDGEWWLGSGWWWGLRNVHDGSW